MSTYYDSHCHIFNASILSDLATGKEMRAPRSLVSDWWDWFSEMVSGAVTSERTNNKVILAALQANFPGQTYATMPLMMDLSYAFSDALETGQPAPRGSFSKGGLRDQIWALQALSSAGNCYPFFSVDPRRPGVVETILDGNLVTRSPGGFYGIKLYPRLGFHPMSGQLPDLYAYCASKCIPVITHCSAGGFWTSTHADFCDPENFRPILAANPMLKIDFAHWGSGNAKWGASILDLMGTYPGVYSDLSCYGSPGDLPGFKNAFWGNPITHSRTMYGSDYNLVYFTQGGITLDAYVKSFIANFSGEELSAMASTNPDNFLGVCCG